MCEFTKRQWNQIKKHANYNQVTKPTVETEKDKNIKKIKRLFCT